MSAATDGFLSIKPTVHTGTLGIASNLFPTEGKVAKPVADIVEPQVSWTGFYVGANVGAGIEAMLTDNLTARAEYRFTQ